MESYISLTHERLYMYYGNVYIEVIKVSVLSTYSKQENVIYVGKKRAILYAMLAAMVLLREERVILKARGRNISNAVSAAIILCRRLINDVKIDKVVIGEECLKKMVARGESKRWVEEIRIVGTIEITLSKNGIVVGASSLSC